MTDSLLEARRSLRDQLPDLTDEELEALREEVQSECARRAVPAPAPGYGRVFPGSM